MKKGAENNAEWDAERYNSVCVEIATKMSAKESLCNKEEVTGFLF